MTIDAWQRMGHRYVWYKQILQEHVNKVDVASIYACTDPKVLEGYLRLFDRVERHHQRIERHIVRGYRLLPTVGGTQ